MTKKDKKIKSEDSNIELIKKELKKTKGGFDFSACESKNPNEFFTYYEKDKNKIPFDKNTIINIIEKVVKVNKKREEAEHTGCIKTMGKLKQTTNISFARLSSEKYKNDEVLWERLIILCNKDKLYNQLCVGKDNKESVDIVYSLDKNKFERQKFIELKTNLNTNNPLFGFVELLKNYILTKKTASKECKTINELIFLAPKFYYKYFKSKGTNFINEFLNLIQNFNKENKLGKVKFKLCYIDIDEHKMNEFVEKLAKDSKDLKNKKRYKPQNEILKLLEQNPHIKEELKYEKWVLQEIVSVEDWWNL